MVKKRLNRVTALWTVGWVMMLVVWVLVNPEGFKSVLYGDIVSLILNGVLSWFIWPIYLAFVAI